MSYKSGLGLFTIASSIFLLAADVPVLKLSLIVFFCTRDGARWRQKHSTRTTGDLLPVQYAHTPLEMLSLKRLGLNLPIMPPPSSGGIFDT
jgi:hypothetical protein